MRLNTYNDNNNSDPHDNSHSNDGHSSCRGLGGVDNSLVLAGLGGGDNDVWWLGWGGDVLGRRLWHLGCGDNRLRDLCGTWGGMKWERKEMKDLKFTRFPLTKYSILKSLNIKEIPIYMHLYGYHKITQSQKEAIK